MASEPRKEHSYILDSFEEFEALARRALHKGETSFSYQMYDKGRRRKSEDYSRQLRIKSSTGNIFLL